VSYTRERLGELLVAAGLITETTLQAVLDRQRVEAGKLGEILLAQGVLSESEIAEALACQKGFDHVDLETYPVDRTVTVLIPESMARRKLVLPLRMDGELLVLAMADPLDIEAVDDVEMRTGLQVVQVVVTPSQLTAAIEKYLVSADTFQDYFDGVAEEEEPDLEALAAAEDVPVVRLVNQLIREAVREGASDLHIEPHARGVIVRYRIDGVMHPVMELPFAAKAGVISRLKIMAEMDIAERRRPQDGRIALRVHDRPVDIRVASLPTPDGESLTLRILNSELAFLSIDSVGLTEANMELLNTMLRAPYGALLISGPTGSGKSTTLYAALQQLNTPVRKIITVEDPVEYQMQGITQMPVNARIGLTFAAGLRTILRSDPDIVMVGEIRDPETAEVAIRAALTGHLVLSSIHTNDAPSALTRLTDMGVPPYITSSGLVGVVAQRLARKLCPDCKVETKVPAALLGAAGFLSAEAKKLKLFAPGGCEKCMQSGYKGRIGVFEVMVMDEHLTHLFLNSAPAEELRVAAVARGMVPIRRDALDKVAAGITSLEEIDRVVI
jgi:type IV pilus assembly protein PilB